MSNAPSTCPTCGEPVSTGFDGATDTPYEQCTRTRYRPPLDPLSCTFYAKPPRWLRAALEEAS